MSDTTNKGKRTSFLQKLCGGAISGIVGVTLVFPLDLVKTRLQNQGKVKVYTGIGDCINKIISREGFKGLYKGLFPNLVGITPEKAIKLAVNDFFRQKFEQPDGSVKLVHAIIAGASAGFFQVVATNPMEIVKIQMQLAGAERKSITAFELVKKMGLKGLYKGTAVTLLRDVPFSIMYFPLFGLFKENFSNKSGQCSPFKVLLSGCIAGTFASAFSTPADVVKTRFQVLPKPGQQPFTSIYHCAKHIYINEGPLAFMKGVLPRICIISPLFGIALTVYEVQERIYMK